MAEAPRPTCAGVGGGWGCEYYLIGSGDAERAIQAGTHVPPGLCIRYPTRVPRRPDDVCGEHQAERSFWLDMLADRIVQRLVETREAMATSPAPEPETAAEPVAASRDET